MGISDIHMFDTVISADGIEGWVVSVDIRTNKACVVKDDGREVWVPIDELMVTQKYEPLRQDQYERGPGPGGW